MKAYIFYGVIIGFLLCSCQKKGIDSASLFNEKLNNPELIDSLENLALNQGDTLAYFQLQQIHYIGEQRFTGFLYYALVMSNKYHYKKASYDVYDILTSRDSSLDDKTKEMANEYLLRSK
jgi:hypothetical protein